MANFGGRYTCLNCDVDGAVDVRRVAPECKEDKFPLATRAYIRPIGVPRAVRKPRGLPSKPGFEGKGYSRKCVVISPNCEVCHGSRGSLAALWAIAVECPCASARAVPAARPLSARTPRDARTTRGCAGCCSAECAAQAEAMACFKIKQVLGVS